MSINYSFVVATPAGEDEALLTPECFSIDSTSLQEIISTYHGAIGEERPYIGWMEDAIDFGSGDATVDADDCTDPDACLRLIATLREGMATHAAVLPPYTWIVQRWADGRRGHPSDGARVRFEGEEWSVHGGFEHTTAFQVKRTGKKARKIDLRTVATWSCQDPSGQPLTLEFDRRPFHLFVERVLTGITGICESARAQGALVAIGSVP